MNSSHSNFNLCLNGEGTVVYERVYKYTGRWENGMKVGEGILEVEGDKLRVKIKQGIIHKSIKLLNNSGSSNNLFTFISSPNLKITKAGDSYKEEEYPDMDRLKFLLRRDIPVFNGRAYPIKNFFLIEVNDVKLVLGKLKDSSSSNSIFNYLSSRLRFCGYSLNFIPYGDCKILYDYIKIKANLRGWYFDGPCIVKHPDYTIFFEIKLNSIKSPIKCVLNSLTDEFYLSASFEESLNAESNEDQNLYFEIKKKNENSFNSNLIEEILNSVLESFSVLKNLKNDLLFKLTPKILTYLLVADTNWKSFEYRIANQGSELKFHTGEKNPLKEVDEKCLKKLGNNERYEGKMVNGKYEGLGKYHYPDGSVYIGEFKKNLRNGIGNFKFKDGRMYRGYWLDNLMHGKGCMVIGDFKIHGIWEMNKLKEQSACSVSKRNSSLF